MSLALTCRHWCHRVLSPPGGCPDGSVAPFEQIPASADEGRQALHQEFNSGRSDQHLLRSRARFGKGKWEILQVPGLDSHRFVFFVLFFSYEHTVNQNNHISMQIACFYFTPCIFSRSDCAATSCSAKGKDDELAQKLWELSCKMLSITWE